MVQSSDGRLFMLTNHTKSNIIFFDTRGKVIDIWTLGLKGAHGLSIASLAGKESLYITCSSSSKVLKTDLDGKIELELPHAKDCKAYSPTMPYRPTETAVAPNGHIYVADGYGSQFILQFEPTGKFVRKFGGKSSLPRNKGKFLRAHGVTLDNRGAQPLLVCTARIRNEFHWFDLDGNHVKDTYLPGAYVSRAVIKGDQLYSGVCFGAYENDYRMWENRGFVTILDKNNKVVSNPGGKQPEYKNNKIQLLLQDIPLFQNCHDVCVDTDENLYVCQWNSGQVYPYKLTRI